MLEQCLLDTKKAPDLLQSGAYLIPACAGGVVFFNLILNG